MRHQGAMEYIGLYDYIDILLGGYQYNVRDKFTVICPHSDEHKQ